MELLSKTRGGYEVEEGLPLLPVIGGETVEMLNDRDSSSWKYKVGKVDPLIRLIAIEPS